MFFFTTAARAQESNLVVPASFVIPPVPRPEPSKKSYPSGRSRFALDRQSLRFGLIQGGAELYDGFTTRYFVHRCYPCTEADPASRLLLGPRPNWTGMIVFGSLEAVATAYVTQSMRSSSHKFIRRLATITPLSIIGVHLIEGTVNLTSTPLLPAPTSRTAHRRR